MIKHLLDLSSKERFLWGVYSISSILLFLYSFTQIDLGLVISRFPFLYSIEQAFQYIGYFNRPLSSGLYVGLLVIFFSLYIYTVKQVSKKAVSLNTVWKIILSICVILFLSYNAFSYDIFNYIFDARILTHYHENPYLHKALDYPADHMLAFMHWTHRVYPYGPVWLAVTVPLSYAGLQLFLPTFYLFKLLMLFSFLGTTYLIGKILKHISPESEGIGIALFALNPLVIFETLISGHNDIFMMFLMVLSLYLLLQKKNGLSMLSFLLSIGVKFATVFLLPIYVGLFFRRKSITESYWNMMVKIGSGLMFLAVLVASYRSNFQPWYLLFVLPLLSLISRSNRFLYLISFLSLIALGNYIPYLYVGTWTDQMTFNLLLVDGFCGVVGVIWGSIILIKK